MNDLMVASLFMMMFDLILLVSHQNCFGFCLVILLMDVLIPSSWM